jgi:hypothetical protein
MLELYYSYIDGKDADKFLKHVINFYFNSAPQYYALSSADGLTIALFSDKPLGLSVEKAITLDEKKKFAVITKKQSVVNYFNDGGTLDDVTYNDLKIYYKQTPVNQNVFTLAHGDYVYSITSPYSQVKSLMVT